MTRPILEVYFIRMAKSKVSLTQAVAAAGITQCELARRLGKTPAMMTHWLKGRRRISLADARKLAAELCVDLNRLEFPGSVLLGGGKVR